MVGRSLAIRDDVKFCFYQGKTSALMDELRVTCTELWHSITTIKPIKLSRSARTNNTAAWQRAILENVKWVLLRIKYKHLMISSKRWFSILFAHHVWGVRVVTICHYLSPTATTAGDRATTTQQQPSAGEISHASGGQAAKCQMEKVYRY